MEFGDEGQSLVRLTRAVDAARERFGTDAVTRAVLLGHDQGLSVPILPD